MADGTALKDRYEWQIDELEVRLTRRKARSRPRCEDRIRNAKDTGLRNLQGLRPQPGLVRDRRAGLRTAQMLALTGKARRWEPKRLRLQIFAVAGRLASGGRSLRLRLAERWPWAADLAAATARLQALPFG